MLSMLFTLNSKTINIVLQWFIGYSIIIYHCSIIKYCYLYNINSFVRSELLLYEKELTHLWRRIEVWCTVIDNSINTI